jgi:hypothetical protein
MSRKKTAKKPTKFATPGRQLDPRTAEQLEPSDDYASNVMGLLAESLTRGLPDGMLLKFLNEHTEAMSQIPDMTILFQAREPGVQDPDNDAWLPDWHLVQYVLTNWPEEITEATAIAIALVCAVALKGLRLHQQHEGKVGPHLYLVH